MECISWLQQKSEIKHVPGWKELVSSSCTKGCEEPRFNKRVGEGRRKRRSHALDNKI